jgi:hypothetical protein
MNMFPANIALLHEQHEALSLSFFPATFHTCSGSDDLSDSKMEIYFNRCQHDGRGRLWRRRSLALFRGVFV